MTTLVSGLTLSKNLIKEIEPQDILEAAYASLGFGDGNVDIALRAVEIMKELILDGLSELISDLDDC